MKTKLMLCVLFIALAELFSSPLEGKKGFEFGVAEGIESSITGLAPSISFKFHKRVYAMQLKASFLKMNTEEYRDSSDIGWGATIGNNWYLPRTKTGLDQFLFLDASIVFPEIMYLASSVGYGLQYNVSESLAFWGKFGGKKAFTDESHYWTTTQGLGMTFYVR